MKRCPYCAEEIQDEAVVCRWCGRDLRHPTPPMPTTNPVEPAVHPRQGIGAGLVVAALAGLLTVIGAFTPWVSFSAPFVGTISRSGTDVGVILSHDGILTLVLGVLGLLVAAGPTLARHGGSGGLGAGLGAMACGALIVVFGALNLVNINDAVNQAEAQSSLVSGSPGVGLWMTLVGGAGLVIAGLWLRSDARKQGATQSQPGSSVGF